jgi:MFS family permease
MSQAGAFMSAFYLGYIATQIPAGILADRFGVRFVLGCSLILEGVATSSFGWIKTYEVGFALRVVAGLGAGAVLASCALSIVEWFPPRERGIAFGVLMATPPAGILATNAMVPSLNAWIGWQGAFQAVGLLTTSAGILVMLLIRSSGEIKSDQKPFLGGFKVIASSPGLVLTALAGFCLMWLELGTATWANAYIKQLGFSVKEAGFVMLFYAVGGVISPLLSGMIGDKTGRHKSLILLCFVLSIPCCIIFGYQKTIFSLSVVGFLLGFCSYIANPLLLVLISQFAGRKWAATANGTANFIYQLASMIGPFVLGWAIDISGDFSIVWWLMAAGPVVGILLMLQVKPAEGVST